MVDHTSSALPANVRVRLPLAAGTTVLTPLCVSMVACRDSQLAAATALRPCQAARLASADNFVELIFSCPFHHFLRRGPV